MSSNVLSQTFIAVSTLCASTEAFVKRQSPEKYRQSGQSSALKTLQYYETLGSIVENNVLLAPTKKPDTHSL